LNSKKDYSFHQVASDIEQAYYFNQNLGSPLKLRGYLGTVKKRQMNSKTIS